MRLYQIYRLDIRFNKSRISNRYNLFGQFQCFFSKLIISLPTPGEMSVTRMYLSLYTGSGSRSRPPLMEKPRPVLLTSKTTSSTSHSRPFSSTIRLTFSYFYLLFYAIIILILPAKFEGMSRFGGQMTVEMEDDLENDVLEAAVVAE